MNSRTNPDAMGNAKVFRSLSYLLVFLLMACAVMTISMVIQNVLPDSNSGILAGVMLFIVIDRLYTYRQLKSLTPLSSEWVINVGAQWIVIVLLIRLLLSYAKGVDSFIRELSLFGRGYFEGLFTPEFVFSLLLALLVWYVSGRFLGLLDEIGVDQEFALGQDTAHIRSQAVSARERLVNLIFSMGIVLVVLTAMARLNLRTILSNVSGIPTIEVSRFSGGEAGALLYFVFGLALLSLGRLISLQTHWSQQRIPVSSKNLTR